MTKIEWTEKTWNPIVGCSVVSPGCTNCYAMKMAARLEAMTSRGRVGVFDDAMNWIRDEHPLMHYVGTTQKSKAGPVWTGKVVLAPDSVLTAPLCRKKPTTYFVNSMSDLFHESVPDEWIDKVFAVMALCPQHTFQVLTKRAERMRAYFSERDVDSYPWRVIDQAHRMGLPEPKIAHDPYPFNAWLGVSCEDQTRADERIPHLLKTPAAVRFISAEPLLGAVDLEHIRMSQPDVHSVFHTINALTGRRGHGGKFGYTETCDPLQPHLDWVIAGSESGPGARPCNLDWVRGLRDQCTSASVPFFFKQHAVNGRKISTPALDGKSWVELPTSMNAF